MDFCFTTFLNFCCLNWISFWNSFQFIKTTHFDECFHWFFRNDKKLRIFWQTLYYFLFLNRISGGFNPKWFHRILRSFRTAPMGCCTKNMKPWELLRMVILFTLYQMWTLCFKKAKTLTQFWRIAAKMSNSAGHYWRVEKMPDRKLGRFVYYWIFIHEMRIKDHYILLYLSFYTLSSL